MPSTSDGLASEAKSRHINYWVAKVASCMYYLVIEAS
jgi:hypothetical protein